jgi:Concanavalin A-like lectin/glucanases superfamily
MRRARQRPLSFLFIAFAIALCTTAALALPPKAEAVIRLGDPNTVSLSNGLVGYWPLDGSVTDWHTNTTRDLSGNGNDGSLALMSTTTSPVGGKIGQALNFKGSNLVSVQNSPSISLSGTTTMSFWFKLTSSPSAYSTIVAKGDASSEDYFMDLREAIDGITDCLPSCYLAIAAWDGGTTQGVISTTDFQAAANIGKWFHAVGLIAGNTYKIYINGSLENSGTGSYGIQTSSKNLNIGNFVDGSRTFPGIIDDVRIYNRALTATEVKQLYNLGQSKMGHSNTVVSNGLVGYWPLDGNTTNWNTNTTADVSGQGNDGTLVSMSKTASPIGGRIGQALSFDGSASYIGTTVNTTVTSATFSAWVKRTGATAYAAILFSRGSSVSGLGTFDNGADISYHWANDAGTYSWASGLTIPLNEWAFVAVSVTPSAATAYLYSKSTGFQKAVNSYTHVSTLIDDLKIGIDDAGGRYFSGSIDDARFYNRALSDAEIKQLYNLGTNKVGHSNTIISNGLVGYWTFDGGSIDWHTNTVADMSGQGNTGTLVSMSTTSSPTPGKIGQAFNFPNASAAYIDAGVKYSSRFQQLDYSYVVQTDGNTRRL